MRISELILYKLVKSWKSPVAKHKTELGENPDSEEFHLNYAMEKQFLKCSRIGFPYDFYQKKILEIGCGQGGIATFLIVNGAKEVIGIDLNTFHLDIGRKFKKKIEEGMNIKQENGFNLEFLEMNAYDMNFQPNSFDLIIADNVFEHFMETALVLEQSFKILKPGGQLVIPSFNSIYSKWGTHLKHGLKLPWANILFSEKTICNVLIRLGKEDVYVAKAYPELKNNPQKLKDIRTYGDLNSMTHKRFCDEALVAGFIIKRFKIIPVSKSLIKEVLNLLYRYKWVQRSMFSNIFSLGAQAILVKPI